jgi:hypothetical protein
MRASMYATLINGIGKIKLQLYCTLILCILHLPVIIFSGLHFGISGIVFGSVIVSLLNIILGQIQLKRLLNNTALGIWNK